MQIKELTPNRHIKYIYSPRIKQRGQTVDYQDHMHFRTWRLNHPSDDSPKQGSGDTNVTTTTPNEQSLVLRNQMWQQCSANISKLRNPNKEILIIK